LFTGFLLAVGSNEGGRARPHFLAHGSNLKAFLNELMLFML
jgi:hypothetical protein